MEYRKICVGVTAEFRREGGIKPVLVRWPDGRIFTVQRVKRAERAPAHVDALLPIRFTCFIAGRDRYLYYEAEKFRWFVESMGE